MLSARMILSVEAMTAACQIWDREKKMLTVAQTIGTNQIPLPSQVDTRSTNLRFKGNSEKGFLSGEEKNIMTPCITSLSVLIVSSIDINKWPDLRIN